MQRIQPVIIGIVKKGNKFLLTKRSDEATDPEDLEYKEMWQFPGGGLEFGEPVEDCLHREMMEETGIEVNIKALIPKIEHEVRHNWHGLFIMYLLTMKDESAEIVLNEESSDYKWCELHEIKGLKRFPGIYRFAKEADKISL